MCVCVCFCVCVCRCEGVAARWTIFRSSQLSRRRAARYSAAHTGTTTGNASHLCRKPWTVFQRFCRKSLNLNWLFQNVMCSLLVGHMVTWSHGRRAFSLNFERTHSFSSVFVHRLSKCSEGVTKWETTGDVTLGRENDETSETSLTVCCIDHICLSVWNIASWVRWCNNAVRKVCHK